MTKIVPHVSDHALLRFLERVKGVDLDAIRAEILSPLVKCAIKAGASAVIIDGHRCPVSPHGTITTIMPRPGPRCHAGRANNGRANGVRA